MMRISLIILAAATAAGFSAALAGPDDTSDKRQGEETNQICFARSISNFKTIDDVDDAVLLERGVNDWYKVDLIGACNYNRLRWAQSVAIDQRPAGGCVSRGDQLIFSDSAFGEFTFQNSTRCIIGKIYKWDEKAGEAGDIAEAGDEGGDAVEQ
jgi:hypothetical protein